MKIDFNEERKLFRLMCGEMEYAFAVNEKGKIVNLYWGTKIDDITSYDILIDNRRIIDPPEGEERICYGREYASGDAFDFETPCIRTRFYDGSETLRLIYSQHCVTDDELIVTLRDCFYPLEVDLHYKTWGDLPIIGRRAVIRNVGDKKSQLFSAKSASIQFPRGRNFRLTHYSGEWGAEYQKNQVMITHSKIQLETNRLTAAACHQLPFFALDEEGRSTETAGEVYFGALMWSGDFQITVEMQHTQFIKQVSVTAGVNDLTAQVPLEAGKEFETPMVLIGYSNRGFEYMSETLYDLQLDYLLPRGEKTDKAHNVRPIIYNTWYPYEFDINEKRLIDLIVPAKEIGAELLVVDDGWMKGRTCDKSGLGDWIVDNERFPRGLGYVSEEVHKHGLLFGIWVEPEMVNPDSDLYRNHPDWILSEPNRERSLMRNQCILDMSRDEIRDWTIDWLDKLIIDAKLDYLKWDMNREVSELGLNAIENGKTVKYMRNIEFIWEHLNKRFPDMIFENCAAGGGRADFGMLRYTDRVNRSDNADPVDTMLLHEGFSTIFLPKLAGGAGNISPSPYYINGRKYPLDFRINIGMTGSMSIGINILKAECEELKKIKDAIVRFKRIRTALHDSYLYRICSAANNPFCVWQYLKRDKSQFTVFAFGHGMHQWNKQMPHFRMRALIPDAVYRCGDLAMTGKALMNIGLCLDQRTFKGDYASSVVTWERTD